MFTEMLGRGLQMLSGRSDLENPQGWFLDWMAGGDASGTSSGEHITPENALRVPAVNAANKVLAESMQTLPMEVVKREKSGRISRAPDHPVQEMFFREVNEETATPTWKNMTQIHLGTYGNSFSEIGRDGRNMPVNLFQKSPRPERTKMIRNPDDGKIWYKLFDKQGREQDPVPAKNMLHIPYFSLDGLMGTSPVRLLREAIGGNKAAERYANELFKNGGTPQGFYTIPGELSEGPKARLEKSLAEQALHGYRHKTAVLEDGMTFSAASLDPEKVQMVQVREFLLIEIARVYRITPHLLQDLTHGTFTNIIELGRQFITFTMMPWMSLWTGEINRKLLEPPYFARFNAKEFLRGDPKVLAAWYRTMFTIGYYSLNDIRAEEGENPILDPNADEHFVPLNLVPLSKATDANWVRGKGGSSNEPKPGAVPGGDGSTPNDATNEGKVAVLPDMSEALDAAVAAVDAVYDRMSTIEANAAMRAAKQPSTFLATLDEFWPKHRTRMSDALTAPMIVLRAIRRNVCENLESHEDEMSSGITEHIGRHHNALLTAAECKADELADRVAEAVASWTSTNPTT